MQPETATTFITDGEWINSARTRRVGGVNRANAVGIQKRLAWWSDERLDSFAILVSRLKKSNSHLALGVFYASVGLLNEPEREFELLGWIKRVRGEEFRAAPTGD